LYDVLLPIYGASKLPNFWILAHFPHTKSLNVPSDDQPAAQGLHCRMITIFPCGSRKSKGVPSGCGVFLRLLVGVHGDPQTCPYFRLWQMAIPMQNATTRRVSSGPKMSENAQFWGRMYFPTKHLCPKPKITPKTPFLGTFNVKPIIQGALHKSHVNGAMKLQL